jgi:glucose-1-phosphate cytidylyltransferase
MSNSMKTVIFAGGRGTRLSEETTLKPKPMVEIGTKPILWHIMKMYSFFGYNDFIVCLGYKGYMIKEWFANYHLHNSDFTIDLSNNQLELHRPHQENWKVTLVDTGWETGTAKRLERVRQYIGDDDFMLTYGDGVSDVDISALVTFHKTHGKIATVTAIKPEGRFGALKIEDKGKVTNFAEKVDNKDNRINGGFFVLKSGVFNFLPETDVMWEREPLEDLAKADELVAYQHDGFWKAMDTLRDKIHLEKLWENGNPPWKKW